MKRNDMDVRFMPTLVFAHCILHNLCEVHGDDFDNDWQCEDETSVNVANSSTVEVIRSVLRDYFV